MSSKERIAKLEGLLARIKQRAEEPRARANGSAVQTTASEDVVRPGSTTPPPTIASSPPQAMQQQAWSEPPPTDADAVMSVEGEVDMDVEVSAEVVEVDIDIDDPGMVGMPAESGAQPVAEAGRMDLEDAHDVEQPPPAANEVVEPAPSSSPRPIVAAAEEESAPRHTPPPESGKQVAAPSVKPEPRKGSVPPPSLEGHTLIGGWREPGIAAPHETPHAAPPPPPPKPAVRVPPPPPPPPPAATAPPTSGAPVSIRAEVTRVELPAGAHVAALQGSVATFAPSSFGELLDATLSI